MRKNSLLLAATFLLAGSAQASPISTAPLFQSSSAETESVAVPVNALLTSDLSASTQERVLVSGAAFFPNAQPPVGSVVPEPSSFLLLGTGLLGMAGALRRRSVN